MNTHHNGDHCWGNQLFAEMGTEIIGHRLCAEYFRKEATPEFLVALARPTTSHSDAVAGFARALRRFDFHDIELTPPTTTIDDDATIDLDGLAVELLYVGPAHTAGDVVAHLPEHGVLFTGDVLFNQCTPIGWEGTFANWIAALERFEALEPAVVVPGHGPVGDDREPAQASGSTWSSSTTRPAPATTPGARHSTRRRASSSARIARGTSPSGWRSRSIGPHREFAGEPWDSRVDTTKVFAEVAALREHFAA